MALRLLALLLAAALAQGCFVWDELEKGEDIMETHGGGFSQNPGASEEPEGPGGDAPEHAAGEEDPGPDTAGWWQKARTLTPGGGEEEESGGSAVVRCQLRGDTRYMSRADCRGRGGTPSG